MQFIRTTDWQPGIDNLTQRLEIALKKEQKVLWLVTGGSNVTACAAIMQRLDDNLTTNLTILLSDERYGSVGHPNSNAAQLDQAGFAPKQATRLSILVDGDDVATTRARYDTLARAAFAQAELIIGQFGIGSDGHIAGILPHSPATTAADFVAAYETPEFTRLTLSAQALKQISVAYAFVFGDSKIGALERLHNETVPFEEQPAQILKELPEAYIYNDHIGDKS